MAGSKADAEAFAKRWAGRGDETQEGRSYWIDLFQNVLGVEDAIERLKFEVPVHTDSGSTHAGYIDVLIPSASALVEMKGRDVDLDKREVRQGREVTPAEQGRGYAVGLPLNQQPRYVIACNFREIRVYDRNVNPLCTGDEYLRLELVELPKNLPALKFLNGGGSAPRSVQRAVSIEAGRIMGQIHNEIAGLYHDPDSEESHHALSVLCTRLMFLMFCEDAGLIEPGLFRDYVASVDGGHLRGALIELFGWLDTDDEARKQEYPSELLARFPYMNGGLFRERIQIPQLNEQVHYEILVSGCQEFDWSGVDPTVFGSIFEGALSHDTRRSGGMHYTSPENIHKVIDPLFLDGLKEELDEILAKQNPGARTRALRAYHDKLGRLTFLDPACGSGNFLTETYVCLRRLENTVLMELQRGGQSEISFEEAEEESPVKVTLANFHGIEVNDFACCVARTALWIAEKQADINTAKVVKRVYDELPLREYGTIIHGNSLRIDWADAVPALGLDFIIGNPPFIGYSNLNDAQKADRAEIFGKPGGVLDYVACWYRKAADFTRGSHTRCAFVSTNSICQGQQVEPLWKPLFDDGVEIDFAHKTFVWNSEATDEAHVHVVIVGFSREKIAKKTIFDGDGAREADNISGYLSATPSLFIARRSSPICDAPKMIRGCQPTDNGQLILDQAERDELVSREPSAEEWIRPFSMGADFINGKPRYCLWLKDAAPKDLSSMPHVMERVRAVAAYRAQSTKAATRKKAETPWLFDEIRETGPSYIGVPKVSSGRRRYIPMGFVDNGMIPGDKLYFIPNASVYDFGILMSQFHNAWMRMVAGRLKSDYSYANTIVYNNFVWPDPTDALRGEVERCAQAVLDARSSYEGSTLADMYDPDNDFLYPALTKAHKALDAAVEAAYGVDFNGDEEKIVAHLFKLYAEKTGA